MGGEAAESTLALPLRAVVQREESEGRNIDQQTDTRAEPERVKTAEDRGLVACQE